MRPTPTRTSTRSVVRMRITIVMSSYEEQATELVQEAIAASLRRLRDEKCDYDESSAWSKSKDFTLERGLVEIERFVQGLNTDESWRHCTDFLGEEDGVFRYAVRWSIPTRRKPVPRATASLFFFIKVHQPDLPVLVMFVVEGQHLVHRPGRHRFQEVWLKHVIDNKQAINQSIEFSIKP